MSWVAVGVTAVGAVTSAVGSAQSAKGAKRAGEALAPQRQLEMQTMEHRLTIAQRLEDLAEKMLADEPINPEERALFDRAQKVATQQIERSGKEAQEQVLGALAGTGFLKSGRAADQIQKLAIEQSFAKDQISLQREQANFQFAQQKQQQAFSLLTAAGNIQTPQFDPNLQPLQAATIRGAGLTQLGGAAISFGGSLAKANAISSAQGRQVSASDPNRRPQDIIVT